MEWRNIYRGFCMGVSDLIPGVSGGTIAVVLGFMNNCLRQLVDSLVVNGKTFRIFNSLAAGVAAAF